eukprot:6181310-Pleurochrysis_carterae.AAC.1
MQRYLQVSYGRCPEACMNACACACLCACTWVCARARARARARASACSNFSVYNRLRTERRSETARRHATQSTLASA